MKIQSIAVLRFNGDTEEAVIMDAAYNLAEYSFFTRGSVREFLTFASKTILKRVEAGVQCIDYEGNNCYCIKSADGLGIIAICDKDYPARVAVAMLRELLDGFRAGPHGAAWRGAGEDMACKFPPLEAALVEYQDPAKVDKLTKVDRQLAETKDILYKTIDAVLARGEKLDELVDKSAQLSQQSKMFYKQAKKTNSCCVVM